MRKIKTEAFVLKKRKLLNQDLLISLFSQELGKITVMAKGVRRITSRRLPHIQTGNLINIVISKHHDYLYLQETSLISAFSQIRKSQDKLNYQYYLLFMLDRLLPERQKENRIYYFVKKFFSELGSSENFEMNIFERYLNKILQLLGYIKEEKRFYELSEVIENLIQEKPPQFQF